MTDEEWISVLKLSTLWGFSCLREKAIGQLSTSTMFPVSWVELARKYQVKEWLIAGYRELVKRPASISMEESERLGWRTTVQLYQLREECIVKRQSAMMPGTSPWGGEEMPRIYGRVRSDDPTERVKVVFVDELKNIGE